MKFRAKEVFKSITKLRKVSGLKLIKYFFTQIKMIKESDSNMPYMLRLPFASGNVFSASMIDTLLYQAFGKPYLIELMRLLIGISQSPGEFIFFLTYY